VTRHYKEYVIYSDHSHCYYRSVDGTTTSPKEPTYEVCIPG